MHEPSRNPGRPLTLALRAAAMFASHPAQTGAGADSAFRIDGLASRIEVPRG